MKEDFLHYVWRFKCFNVNQLFTITGESIQLLQTGDYLQTEGPDFFNAQLIIGSQKWAGTVEIHLKSSDWYVHHHETDSNYDNVILHVVWEYDLPVYRTNNSEIPVLELQHRVDPALIQNYHHLLLRKEWLPCEQHLSSIPQFVLYNWLERLYFERLAQKAIPVLQLLKAYKNDWESVLFVLLAKNFGLNTNGDAFFQVAQSIRFSQFCKEAVEVHQIEALLMGQAGILPESPLDTYTQDLCARYDFLKLKYSMQAPNIRMQYFKLRPDNFPTIRLAQLAMVYHKRQQLFQAVWNCKVLTDFEKLFHVGVSSYWETHYTFDKPSRKKSKQLSKSFIYLLIINTLVPLKFAYAQHLGKFDADAQLVVLQKIPPESNTVIDKFAHLGIQAQHAQHSQALLELKKSYCDLKKCLNCAIGTTLLKTNR
ncbi:DUF2851 family protein [Flavobacterium sp.]|uniref:DUF2851 family protein n=1 Tax=Flavobacterium sp. TaxID=239 RepID=UPI00260753C5|nr:DUF2851 family protein [Flavobacterium sp.]